MNGNQNMVQKPKEEESYIDDEEEEVEEVEETSTSSKSMFGSGSDDAKQKLIKLMLIIVGVTVVFLLLLFIISLFTKKTYTYTDVENIMKDAAISYFEEYPDYLPTQEGSIVEVDAVNLISAGKMKDLSEYLGDGVACSGTVQVQRAGNDFLYTPYLNCGESYLTQELYKKVASETVTTGDGLYAAGNAYIFRGENVNNYVELDKSVWRIVKVNSDGSMVLINSDGIQFAQPWDDRYNEEQLFEAGINQYSVSRIKDYLDKVYNNPSKEDGEDILSEKDKSKLIPFSVCIGKRSENSEGKNNSEECMQTLKGQYLGLLTLSDYLYASLDANCKSAATRSCKNYNYLVIRDEWWLVTASKDDTYSTFKVNQSGNAEKDNASTYATVRPVIYLNSRVLYKSGEGTLEKPYKVK